MRSDRLLTPEQVAAMLQLETETVLRMIRRGDLAASKVARRWRIAQADVAACLEARRTTTTSHAAAHDPDVAPADQAAAAIADLMPPRARWRLHH